MKRTISTSDVPTVVDAYNQATMSDGLLLTMGQLPSMPDGELLDDVSVGDQTGQCLENVAAILVAEDASLDDVLKATALFDDIDDLEEFNEVYGEFFGEDPLARSAVEADNVPRGTAIKIEAVAVTEQVTRH